MGQIEDPDFAQLPNNLSVLEVGHVDERAVVEPLTLDYHLDHVDAVHGCTHVSLVRGNIDHALEDSDGLVENRFGIADVVGDWERAPLEMSLEKQV